MDSESYIEVRELQDLGYTSEKWQHHFAKM
jgi:hypothetical protein